MALKSRNAQKKRLLRRRKNIALFASLAKIRFIAARGRQRRHRCSVRLPGAAASGSGSASPFGNRFGYYEQLIRDKVARNWRSQDLDASVHNPVVVTFDILRNGSIQNVHVTRSSGNFAADQSAQRAILMSNPFQPLPAQYERDTATIEFSFRLQ